MKFGKDGEGKKIHHVNFLKKKWAKVSFTEEVYFQAAEPLSDQL